MAAQTVEIPVKGMDCASCVTHVQEAIAALPGVRSVQVLLSSEKAIIRLDPQQVDIPTITQAIISAGYSVPETVTPASPSARTFGDVSRPVLTVFGIVFCLVLFVTVVGEWLGFFEALTSRVPWPLGAAIVLVAGYPIFRHVVAA